MKNSKTQKSLVYITFLTSILTISIVITQEGTHAQSTRSKKPSSTNGSFVKTIQSLPERMILEAMAAEEANGKKSIDWDSAIVWTDELIQLSEHHIPESSITLENHANRGDNIRRHVVYGSWIKTKERLAKGRRFRQEIADQRSAFNARLKAFEKKHGKKWVDAVLAEESHLTDQNDSYSANPRSKFKGQKLN